MPDRGLIFQPPHIPLLKAGTKTQTRRLLNPQPFKSNGAWHWQHRKDEIIVLPGVVWSEADVREQLALYAPIQPGDRVYSKERHKLLGDQIAIGDGAQHVVGPWRPSIFQPKWAARWWGRCVSVRVERVQEISAEDVIAEGFWRDMNGYLHVESLEPERFAEQHYGPAFAKIWDSIHGEGAWESNPFVWIYELETLESGR